MKKPGFHTQRLLEASTFPLSSPRMRDFISCLLWDGRDPEAFEISDFFIEHMTHLPREEWQVWHGIWFVLLTQRARRESRRKSREHRAQFGDLPKRTKRVAAEIAVTVAAAKNRSAS